MSWFNLALKGITQAANVRTDWGREVSAGDSGSRRPINRLNNSSEQMMMAWATNSEGWICLFFPLRWLLVLIWAEENTSGLPSLFHIIVKSFLSHCFPKAVFPIEERTVVYIFLFAVQFLFRRHIAIFYGWLVPEAAAHAHGIILAPWEESSDSGWTIHAKEVATSLG